VIVWIACIFVVIAVLIDPLRGLLAAAFLGLIAFIWYAILWDAARGEDNDRDDTNDPGA
jgi:hypothetical protein